MHPLVLAAAGAGILFSIYNVCGRIGLPRGLHMLHIATVVGLCGGAWFTLGAWRDVTAEGTLPPIWLIGAGAFNGTVRYLGVVLWNRALMLGPLSLLACATNLGFIMTVPYVWLFHHQTSSLMQWGAVVLAMTAVALAAKANAAKRAPAPEETKARGAGIEYFLILLGIWLCGGLGNVIVKELDLRCLGDGRSSVSAFGNCFWMFEYYTMGLCALADCVVRKRRPGAPLLAVGLGLATITAAVLGIMLLRMGITMHPAVYFSTSNVAAIVFSVMLGTFGFHEKRSVWWHLTVLTAIAVVLLANAGAISQAM